jgi:tetratricopeptide (TPR) repeat protein
LYVLYAGSIGDITEEDPVWLKAKGDDFFRSGDIRSALNAYNAALDLDDSMLSCLSNRAVCHLRLGMSTECKMDCTKGIDFILEECRDNSISSSGPSRATDNTIVTAPPPQQQLQSKNGALLVKLYMRRGAASCLAGSFTEALVDYHQANSKYQQLNMTQISSIQGVSLESLAMDIQRLKLLVDADSFKKQGDSLFAEKRIHEAKIKYDQAVALVPVHVSCVSNRAACSIALDDYNSCIEDCSTAISLLRSNLGDQVEGTVGSYSSLLKQHEIQQQEHLRNMLSAILPHEGSEKRKSWLMKTLLRRGVALIQMNRHRDALKDYQLASSLDPSNEAIRADTTKLYDLIASSEPSLQ